MLLSRMSDQKQLAVYIHPVTDLEIEEIIEVGQSHGFSREPDLNGGLPGNIGFLIFLICRYHFLLFAGICAKSTNSKCHDSTSVTS